MEKKKKERANHQFELMLSRYDSECSECTKREMTEEEKKKYGIKKGE